MHTQMIQHLLNTQLTVRLLLKTSTSVRRQKWSFTCIRAFHNDEIKDEHGKSNIAKMINYWYQRFENEGISEPRQSIDYIVAHVLGTKKISDLVNMNAKKLNEEQLQKLDLLCHCRLSRMPVQYIIGEWDFRDITLKLEPPIFIPRPETEILVDYLLKRIDNYKKDTYQVLEIGCGSGAISLSLLKSKTNVRVTAIDVNPHACELTIRNAQNLKLRDSLIILNAELKEDGKINVLKEYTQNKSQNFDEEKFDFIVSNPPYIPTKTIFKLQPEIKLYEDVTALDGGVDGLDLIKKIIKYACKALRLGGFLILEVDSSHPNQIEYVIQKNYAKVFKVEGIYKDFHKNDRFIEILKFQ